VHEFDEEGRIVAERQYFPMFEPVPES